MKFLSVLSLLGLNLMFQTNCDQFVYDYYKDVTIISHALMDIVEEFLLSENTRFDINIFNGISQLHEDILADFMSKVNGKFSYQMVSYNDFGQHIRMLQGSNIFAIKSLNDFDYIERFLKIVRYQNQPIKYFIIVPNMTFNQLRESEIHKNFKSLNVHSNSIFHYSYFITIEKDIVTLSTVEWFSPNGCNTPYFSILNTFNKTTMSWSTKLTNYEKFLNYHGCELVMMVPTIKHDRTIDNVCGFSLVAKDLTNFDVIGITPGIFEISSKFYNYTPEFQPVVLTYQWFELIKPRVVNMIKINGKAL